MKQVCNKCESNKLVFDSFEYCGDYASHDYLCLECEDQGKIYYDINYTITNNYFARNETKKHNQKAKP
jgi:hypothetical protein